MTTIVDAMSAILAVQESIAITSPETRQVKKAWRTVPPASMLVAANLPAFTNALDWVSETRSGVLRQLSYVVHMRLHVGQASAGDNSKLAEIAEAFLPAIITAFGAKNSAGIGGITLAGTVNGSIVPTVTYTNISGGSPTVGVFGEGDNRTVGLDIELELGVSEAFVYS